MNDIRDWLLQEKDILGTIAAIASIWVLVRSLYVWPIQKTSKSPTASSSTGQQKAKWYPSLSRTVDGFALVFLGLLLIFSINGLNRSHLDADLGKSTETVKNQLGKGKDMNSKSKVAVDEVKQVLPQGLQLKLAEANKIDKEDLDLSCAMPYDHVPERPEVAAAMSGFFFPNDSLKGETMGEGVVEVQVKIKNLWGQPIRTGLTKITFLDESGKVVVNRNYVNPNNKIVTITPGGGAWFEKSISTTGVEQQALMSSGCSMKVEIAVGDKYCVTHAIRLMYAPSKTR